MDLVTPPPDLYGRPRDDRFMRWLTAFGDRYSPALGSPGLRRSPRRPAPAPVPPLVLETDEERALAAAASERRTHRLARRKTTRVIGS